FRVDAEGNIICRSDTNVQLAPADAERVAAIARTASTEASSVFFGDGRDHIVFAVKAPFGADRADSVVARIPVAALRQEILKIRRLSNATIALEIAESGAVDMEAPAADADPAADTPAIINTTRVPGLSVRYEEPTPRLSAGAIATIAAPTVMWLAALLIGWLTVRRLVAWPLKRMQRALEARATGDTTAMLSDSAGDTQELTEFAAAYDRLAAKQLEDRDQREAALAAQERLVREVHHRVKNNLQIITSLLSIRARDTENPTTERTYGEIQMRVSALSNVHRWLHADDIGRGVDLAALLTDLVAGLDTAIEAVEHVKTELRLDATRVFVSQDAAVPLSFFVTEVFAAHGAELRRAGGELKGTVALTHEDETSARLQLQSDSFRGDDPFAATDRSASARIINGMARQLRGKLIHDSEAGSYAVIFAIASDPSTVQPVASAKPVDGAEDTMAAQAA
ncbi:MAG: sensor histidine kinase, partial [Pseudomonadota bacterium]